MRLRKAPSHCRIGSTWSERSFVRRGYPGPDSRDACRARLDPDSLRAECLARSLPYVDLGSPSVAGGGLVNGFPPRLPPYHEWEAALYTRETKDAAGHIHKSHIELIGW